MNDLTWSKSEKKLAKKAFDLAYQRECNSIMTRLKGMLKNASGPRDIWLIHDYLSEQRRETDKKYDYRYSHLIFVFARLRSEGWLEESDLRGLGEDKILQIKQILDL